MGGPQSFFRDTVFPSLRKTLGRLRQARAGSPRILLLAPLRDVRPVHFSGRAFAALL